MPRSTPAGVLLTITAVFCRSTRHLSQSTYIDSRHIHTRSTATVCPLSYRSYITASPSSQPRTDQVLHDSATLYPEGLPFEDIGRQQDLAPSRKASRSIQGQFTQHYHLRPGQREYIARLAAQQTAACDAIQLVRQDRCRMINPVAIAMPSVKHGMVSLTRLFVYRAGGRCKRTLSAADSDC